MKKSMRLLVVILCLQGLWCFASERISSYPFISGDTFRAIAHHIVDETNQPFNPGKVKPYDIIFLKTDYADKFFETLHPKIANKYILITHNSDASPIFLTSYDHPWTGRDMSSYLNDEKLVVWFAQNIDYVHPKLRPLPIGIGNNYTYHGKIDLYRRAVRSAPALDQRSKKVYINFTPTTNPAERKPALEFFSQQSYAYITSAKAPADYLEELKQYRYVISPEGNGLDCHRTWEALLMGAIPVMKHSLLDSMFEDLPVILVHDWSEVTEQFLDEQYEIMRKKTYRTEKIYADYWIALLKSFQKMR